MVDVSKIRDRFEMVMSLQADPELDNAMANAIQSKSHDDGSESAAKGHDGCHEAHREQELAEACRQGFE